jgi:succinate-semialdehyde dehydrogenase/glutarate-semialdehyde dehydrogenase
MKTTLKLNDSSLLKHQAFIDGQWVDADNGHTLPVTNPANNEVIADVAQCGTDDTRRMIDAAHKAQQQWAKTAAKDRASLLRRWYDLIMDNHEDLAQILTAEQGKPLAEARGEITYGANYVEWFAEEAKRIYGDLIPAPGVDKRLMVLKQPVGVVACITPWNFPKAMLTRKIAPAIAAGCAVVCKPASATPLSALAVIALAERAGIPKGLINIAVGNTRDIGSELTSNPLVRKLTFTGSTEVGKQLMSECSGTVKRTSMELGGNAPFIVFDSADIDAAVQGAMVSKYRNSGQTCVCSNRLLIQSGVYKEFTQKLTEAVENLHVGTGIDDDTNIGPLINKSAADNVCALIDDAVTKGANVVIGGQRSDLGPNFVQPTILTDVSTDMRLFSEEIFGPVAPLFKFETEEEAIRLANDTEFGLACYFYTQNINQTWRVAEQLEYGIVGVNEGLISNEMAPFGGIKESGQGREGSRYGLDDYLELKYICHGNIEN